MPPLQPFHREHLPDIQVRIGEFGKLNAYDDVSFVIPWLDNDNPKRSRNLRFVLSLLGDLGAQSVILAVQGKTPENLSESVTDVINLNSSGDRIRKAELINLAVRLSRPWLFQIDADLVFDFAGSLRRARPTALNLPYRAFQMLTEAETNRLIKTGSIRVRQNPLIQNSTPVAGSFLMRSSLMQNQFTFDEKMRGWSGEDLDFYERVRAKFPVVRLPDFGVHLDHGADRKSPKRKR